MEGGRNSITVGVWIRPRKASVKTVTSFVCVAKNPLHEWRLIKGSSGRHDWPWPQVEKSLRCIVPDWILGTMRDFLCMSWKLYVFLSWVEIYSLSWLFSFVISIGLNLARISQELLEVCFLLSQRLYYFPEARGNSDHWEPTAVMQISIYLWSVSLSIRLSCWNVLFNILAWFVLPFLDVLLLFAIDMVQASQF